MEGTGERTDNRSLLFRYPTVAAAATGFLVLDFVWISQRSWSDNDWVEEGFRDRTRGFTGGNDGGNFDGSLSANNPVSETTCEKGAVEKELYISVQ